MPDAITAPRGTAPRGTVTGALPGPAARLWARNRFHLSLLALLVPALLVPHYFQQEADMFAASRVLPARQVGPWTVHLTEMYPGPAYTGPGGETMKDFAVALGPGQMEQVRAVYLRVGKPRNIRTAGAIGHGVPFRPHAHVPFPANPTGEEEFWVTVEAWDGSTHQAFWPIKDVIGQPVQEGRS